MTREEKIAELVNIRDNFNYTLAPREVFDDAIKALEQEPCEDAISRQAVVDFLENHAETYEDVRVKMGFKASASLINNRNNLPPVNPQPKTGHWIEIAQYSDGKHKIKCSECGSHIFDRGHANSFNVKNKYKYCPNCGCAMVEPQESEVRK